jgi:hypothetical protein
MKYLKVYTDFAEAMEALSDAERGRLFMSMLQYASTGEAGTPSGAERFVWPIAKQNIDRAQAELEKKAENGRKGGRPKKANESGEKQPKAKESKKKQTKDNKDKDKDKDKENNIIPLSPNGDIPPKGERPPVKRFIKPTAEEVRAYCAERGNHVDAQAFVDFYEAKGWKVGSSPMKDWKAAVRTWEKRDAERKQSAMSRPNRQRDLYSSRAYSAAELDSLGTDLLGGG